MLRPRRFTASATRSWPQAGGSMAIATTAAATSAGVRFFRVGGTAANAELGLRRLISARASSPPLYSSLKRSKLSRP